MHSTRFRPDQERKKNILVASARASKYVAACGNRCRRPQHFPLKKEETSCSFKTPGRGEKINGWAPKLSSLSCNLSSPTAEEETLSFSTGGSLLNQILTVSQQKNGLQEIHRWVYYTHLRLLPPLRHVFFRSIFISNLSPQKRNNHTDPWRTCHSRPHPLH